MHCGVDCHACVIVNQVACVVPGDLECGAGGCDAAACNTRWGGGRLAGSLFLPTASRSMEFALPLLLLLAPAAATNVRDDMQCWSTRGSTREVTRNGDRVCFYGHCIGLCEDCSPLCGEHGEHIGATHSDDCPAALLRCLHCF